MNDQRPKVSEADLFRALFNLGPPEPRNESDEPPAEPEPKPAPDSGGGQRGKTPGSTPASMDDVLRLAARGGLRDGD